MEFEKTKNGMRVFIAPRIIITALLLIGSALAVPKIDVPSTFYAVQAVWR